MFALDSREEGSSASIATKVNASFVREENGAVGESVVTHVEGIKVDLAVALQSGWSNRCYR